MALEGCSASIVPDLRRSSTLPTKETWKAIVSDSALQNQENGSFKKYLSDQYAEAVRAWRKVAFGFASVISAVVT